MCFHCRFEHVFLFCFEQPIVQCAFVKNSQSFSLHNPNGFFQNDSAIFRDTFSETVRKNFQTNYALWLAIICICKPHI